MTLDCILNYHLSHSVSAGTWERFHEAFFGKDLILKKGHFNSFGEASLKFIFAKPPLTLLTKGLP